MKKFYLNHIATIRTEYLILATLLVMFLSVGFLYVVEARSSAISDDIVVEQAEAVDSYLSHLEVVATSTEVNTILVDKSDVTNFPHFSSGVNGIEVFKIRVDWTANDAATTTVKFGVFASTTLSGANTDIYWFDTLSFSTRETGANYNGRYSKEIEYSPASLKLYLSSGAPSHFITNDSVLFGSAYATTTNVISPNGYIAPGVGDFVMQIYAQEGTATTTVSSIYRVK